MNLQFGKLCAARFHDRRSQGANGEAEAENLRQNSILPQIQLVRAAARRSTVTSKVVATKSRIDWKFPIVAY
ncbi:MAG: hypothetical protein J0J10_00220 [Bosea sp.]|uniref:hypothetical protein n=1 Tax=Bosea sp. (in: a-proteobacteria) TaxID=1871050 RepID=UPI001AC4DE06|nr:hypothetical protein [Bosea sp. (in: a-proteobacteria)]MBN9467179.1 hypothetical protein [Bosea sp. (in: a-proteobacteria)]